MPDTEISSSSSFLEMAGGGRETTGVSAGFIQAGEGGGDLGEEGMGNLGEEGKGRGRGETEWGSGVE